MVCCVFFFPCDEARLLPSCCGCWKVATRAANDCISVDILSAMVAILWRRQWQIPHCRLVRRGLEVFGQTRRKQSFHFHIGGGRARLGPKIWGSCVKRVVRSFFWRARTELGGVLLAYKPKDCLCWYRKAPLHTTSPHLTPHLLPLLAFFLVTPCSSPCPSNGDSRLNVSSIFPLLP